MGRIWYESAMMEFLSRAARRMPMIFDAEIFAGWASVPAKMERGPRAT
jgi:hypothetical protein